MGNQATYGIAITASDQTAKGAKSAEKTIDKTVKNLGKASQRAGADADKAMRGSGRNIIRTFGTVEKAAAKVFGGRSITGGLASRLAGATDAASALGSGLGEASAAGGVLEGALGGIGVAAAATVGVLAAAANGAFKLADRWAKGAASIGRTAEIIGVTTKALQEFDLAAERVGVDRGTAAGAVGGLSQTLNDARYGRNSQALAVLARLGVAMKLNSDGTVDAGAMLPAIADAIARQNSSGRRTAARALGIPEAALPAFSQGGKALSSDMADASARGNVLDDAEIAKGKKLQRRDTIGAQIVERGVNAAKEAVADVVTGAGDLVLSGARQFSGSVNHSFRPAAEKIDRAVDRFEGAVNYSAGGGGRLTREGAISEARKGVRLRDKLVKAGFSPADATALAANAVRESGADFRRHERGGGGVGLWQWTNAKRKADFRRVMGVDVTNSSEDQQIKFLKWELSNTEAGGWTRAHQNGSDAGSVAAGFTAHVERPANIPRDSAERAAVARALETIPIKVTVEMKGHVPPGTTTTVHGGRGNKPAVSRALTPAYIPVHGG